MQKNHNRRLLLVCLSIVAIAIVAVWIPEGSRGSNEVPPASSNNRGSAYWLFPGEYESHQAMWMLWPVFENKAGFPSTEPVSDMIDAMQGHVHVNLGVQDDADEAAARDFLT